MNVNASLRFAAGALAIVAAGVSLTAPTAAMAQGCLTVPVSCKITSSFGPRYDPITKNFSSEYHQGVDFGCPINTPIKAADAGTVIVAGFSQSAGNWVVTKSNGTGTVFKYMHGERVIVTPGMMVTAGQQVSFSGNTGRSTGPHLHFQMEVAGKAADPMPKLCGSPAVGGGVLQGVVQQSDIVDPGSQPTAPGDSGGTPPAMGLDGSIFEVLGDIVASRALNPDYMRQLATLSEPRLYAELAYMKAIRLKVDHERGDHKERMMATEAMIQVLMTEASLRPQLDAQRAVAARSAAEARR